MEEEGSETNYDFVSTANTISINREIIMNELLEGFIRKQTWPIWKV
jgi:hypothetical protein